MNSNELTRTAALLSIITDEGGSWIIEILTKISPTSLTVFDVRGNECV